MKLLRILFLFAIVLTVSSQGYSKAALDKSQLLVYITNSAIALTNWAGLNYGWDADDNLIGASMVLTYPKFSTNSISNITQYLYPPKTTENRCELSDDSKMSSANSQTSGEIFGLWFTWDTNGFYYAIQGQSVGRWNNILFLIDRVTNVGTRSMQDMNTGWKRNINLYQWDTDFYLGFWCANDQPYLTGGGGYQAWRTVSIDPSGGLYVGWEQLCSVAVGGAATWNIAGLSNTFFMNFNGNDESDSTERVVLGFVKWSLFTNGMSPTYISNMTIKIAAVSTGPDDGSPVYDFCPDNLGGINPLNPRVALENYFLLNVFTNGHVNTNYSPQINGKMYAIPGASDYLSIIVPEFSSAKDNFSNNTSYLVPDQGGEITFTIDAAKMDSIGYLYSVKVYVFDLAGNKVATIYDGVDTLDNSNIGQYLKWDGKDDKGSIVGMGTYIVVLSGFNPSSDAIKLKGIVNVIR
ncbi:MAG: hypothetical protein HPY53_05305 [Brevinematales bacterium]|nr:hypothetical protein [Brevinematales bacterium]